MKNRRSITLESIKKNSIVCLIWQVVVVILFYLILGTGWLQEYSKVQIFAYLILGLVVSLVIHELTHALFMRIFSREKITVQFERGNGIIAYFAVKLHDNLKRGQLTVVRLAPAVFLTLIPTSVMLYSGYRSVFAFAFVMSNFCSSYLDFIDTMILWRRK